MSATSVLVGATAAHMATRVANDDDCDGASYLHPVLSEPVVRLLQPMVDGDEEPTYDYAEQHSRPASCSPQLSEPPRPMPSGSGMATAAAGQADAAVPAVLSCSSSAAASDEPRPPRGRMALLEKTLGEEAEVRLTLAREEHALRLRLMIQDHEDLLDKRRREHEDLLQRRQEEHLLTMEIKREQLRRLQQDI